MINTTLTTLKLFVPTDVYYYAVDNRPLWELGKNDLALATNLIDVIEKNEEIASFITENPSIEAGVGGKFKCRFGGTIISVVVSNTTPGSSGSTVVDVNNNGTTVFTQQAHRPVLAFDDADGVTEVTLIDQPTVAEGDILTIDIDTLQAGTPRWVRVDIFIRRPNINMESDDYVILSNEIVLPQI